MGDNLTYQQPLGRKLDHLTSLAGLPDWMTEGIRAADELLLQARSVALAGDRERAEALRDQATAIYLDLDARYLGQPGAQDQEQKKIFNRDDSDFSNTSEGRNESETSNDSGQ